MKTIKKNQQFKKIKKEKKNKKKKQIDTETHIPSQRIYETNK